MAFASMSSMVKISDDAPKGNYHKLIATGAKKKVNAKASFAHAGKNLNTWILFVQYACSFGVELTMNNAAALYFRDTLGESVESAAAIASIFGFMNLFARGLGGYLSDRVNKKYSMRGRLWVQIGLMAIEGALIIVFSRTNDLAGAIITMTIFSIFVQACEGSTYSIVPYQRPRRCHHHHDYLLYLRSGLRRLYLLHRPLRRPSQLRIHQRHRWRWRKHGSCSVRSCFQADNPGCRGF